MLLKMQNMINIKGVLPQCFIRNYVETRFDTSTYELERPSMKGKNKKVGLMKNELNEKIMKAHLILRGKN